MNVSFLAFFAEHSEPVAQIKNDRPDDERWSHCQSDTHPHLFSLCCHLSTPIIITKYYKSQLSYPFSLFKTSAHIVGLNFCSSAVSAENLFYPFLFPNQDLRIHLKIGNWVNYCPELRLLIWDPAWQARSSFSPQNCFFDLCERISLATLGF